LNEFFDIGVDFSASDFHFFVFRKQILDKGIKTFYDLIDSVASRLGRPRSSSAFEVPQQVDQLVSRFQAHQA